MGILLCCSGGTLGPDCGLLGVTAVAHAGSETFVDPAAEYLGRWDGMKSTVIHDASDRFVRVRGASENNLKNVDVDVPRDALVAFTGVSGSGKSSLAFGTLYAEAQRRYFESVAPYARRLLQQVNAPHVDEITGLPHVPRWRSATRCRSVLQRPVRAPRWAR